MLLDGTQREQLAVDLGFIRSDKGEGFFTGNHKMPLGSGFLIVGGALSYPDARFDCRGRICAHIEAGAMTVVVDRISEIATGQQVSLQGIKTLDMTSLEPEDVAVDYGNASPVQVGVRADLECAEITAWTVGPQGVQAQEVNFRHVRRLMDLGSTFANRSVAVMPSD